MRLVARLVLHRSAFLGHFHHPISLATTASAPVSSFLHLRDLTTLNPNEERAQRYLEKYGLGRGALTETPRPTTTPDSSSASSPPTTLSTAVPNLKRRIPAVTGALPSTRNMRDFLIEQGALDISVIDVRQKASFTNEIIVLNGRSGRHALAIAEALVMELRERDVKVDGEVVRVDGKGEEGLVWLIVDVGKVVVHCFEEEARKVYDLEGLWLPDIVEELQKKDEG